MPNQVFGVDLRASPKRPSAVVVLNDESELSFLKTFSDDTELLEMAAKHQPSLIAIGAPLSLPTGLCCLETSCECNMTPGMKGRQAELELSRMGISCFFTNKSSIIRAVIYRGIELNRKLTGMGYKVIEVYSHATKTILFIDKLPPKKSPEALTFMREHLKPLIRGLAPHSDSLDRNMCDALVNAHTAVLHSREETSMLGNEREGFIIVPQLPR